MAITKMAWILYELKSFLRHNFYVLNTYNLQQLWQAIPLSAQSVNQLHPKRIVFVLPSGMNVGGVNTWSIEMAKELNLLNRPTAFIRYPDIDIKINPALPFNSKIVDCHCDPFPQAHTLLNSLASYREMLPSIFIPNYHATPYAACACLSIHDPEKMRVIGLCHADQIYYYALLVYYEPIIHRFIAVSHEIEIKLKRILPWRVKDIITLPYGVDIPQPLQKTYSHQGEPIILTYAGRLVEIQKRISDLVKLAKILSKVKVNFQLHIIGSGPDKEKLKRLINQLDHSTRRRIVLLDPVPHEAMPKQWQTTDIVVLVSDYEGTSISMLEAMAHGCVPVVTKVSGTQALIAKGDNGFLCPVGKLDEMAYFIKKLDKNRNLLSQLGHNAYKTVLTHNSTQQYVPNFLHTVDETFSMPARKWPMNRYPFLHRINLWALERKLYLSLTLKGLK